MRVWVAMLMATGMAIRLSAGAAFAHHSFSGEFDGSVALTLHGVVASVEVINPHSYIYLDVRTAHGAIERWALESPSARVISRRGLRPDFLKAGDELGVCGYPSRRVGRLTRIEPVTGRAARRLSAAVLTLPSGEKRLWENYRQGKCGLDHERLLPALTEIPSSSSLRRGASPAAQGVAAIGVDRTPGRAARL